MNHSMSIQSVEIAHISVNALITQGEYLSMITKLTLNPAPMGPI